MTPVVNLLQGLWNGDGWAGTSSRSASWPAFSFSASSSRPKPSAGSDVLVKIVLSETLSYCFGVRKTLELTDKLLAEKPGRTYYMLGEIVHNEHVIEVSWTRACASSRRSRTSRRTASSSFRATARPGNVIGSSKEGAGVCRRHLPHGQDHPRTDPEGRGRGPHAHRHRAGRTRGGPGHRRPGRPGHRGQDPR